MKIAILSTPSNSLPPIGYAGIERVVYDLAEGLVKKHHQVTVFATGDSKISGNLKYYYKKALRPSSALTYNPYYFLNHAYSFIKFTQENNFDIIHFNDAGRISLYFAQFLKNPFVTTLHGSYVREKEDSYRIKKEKIAQLLLFKDLPYISISNFQRKALPNLNYVGTVYNSVDISKFNFSGTGGDSMVWLGRVAPDKGLDIAIKTADFLKKRINIYGFVDQGQKDYFESTLEPLIDKNSNVNFTSNQVKDYRKKSEILSASRLFLFPIRWEEPFGLVMIEAMATGTPVVAFARGSVPEVIKDGQTGFIVNPSDQDIRGDWIVKKTGIDGLCEAVEKIYSMPKRKYLQMRKNARTHVEKNFTIERMTCEYEKIYERILSGNLR